MSNALKLTKLQGTVLQIKFANSLRREKLQSVQSTYLLNKKEQLLIDILTWLMTIDSAVWWIDHKHFTASDFIDYFNFKIGD